MFYRIYTIYSVSNRIEQRFDTKTYRQDPAIKRVLETSFAKRLEWFFKAPVWEIKKRNGINKAGSSIAVEVNVYDLRFKSMVINMKTPFLFRFLVPPDGRVERFDTFFSFHR